ncbi:uncharacterized protein LOC108628111 [Ceratina calcarata]|uniref:Uncharacterized protein LOC108628111 n=1 Tax=Ceratina calcarata TaxID=156304 RepID=A0AAJ7J5E5_9HYME|nr:uncharacterized protein LOC108628111 [Ceratina calcarata]
MSKKGRVYKLYQYSDSDLEKAFEKCRNGESFRKVAAELNVPRSTLFAKIKKNIPLRARRGPKTILLKEEENRLKNWILNKARLGFPMHSDEVKIAVKKILDEAGRESMFKDNKPGDKWMQLFLKRHPEIKEKLTELALKSHVCVSEEKLREWFSGVKSYLEETNSISVLERPESIFNGDETSIPLYPKSGRLLGPGKERNFHEISTGKETETVTVLCSFSAAGASLPPMIMFPYKRIPAYLTKSVPADWSIGRSESGWTVSSTFYQYIANVFYPWCVKQNVQFPVIYFLNGHKSHLSLELSDFCTEHNIILVSLFPHATHIIQPCDVAIFRPMKYKWRDVVELYQQETQALLTKATFAPLFKKAFDRLSVDTIKNGFRKCGLYPFNADAIDYDRCISTRRQQMKGNVGIEETRVSLKHSDFISTKKFFDCFLEKRRIQEFTEIRKNNQSCNDETYLLWKTCIEKLELAEAEESQCTKETTAENHCQHNFMEDNVSTSDDGCDGIAIERSEYFEYFVAAQSKCQR